MRVKQLQRRSRLLRAVSLLLLAAAIKLTFPTISTIEFPPISLFLFMFMYCSSQIKIYRKQIGHAATSFEVFSKLLVLHQIFFNTSFVTTSVEELFF
jgi:hypothetical protein